MADPEAFDPKSLRTVSRGQGHKIVVGCPVGEFIGGQCRVGTRVQTVLHPREEEEELVRQAVERRVPIIAQAQALLYTEAMGHVFTKATFKGPKESVTVDVLVDTGATFTVIPPEILRRIGREAIDRVDVRVAGGRTVEATAALVVLELAGREAPVSVLVLEGQDPVLIGVETLEVLGLRVDPAARPPRIEPSRPFTLGVFKIKP